MEDARVLETFANGAKRIRRGDKTLIVHPDGSEVPSRSGIVMYLRSIDPVPTNEGLCCVSYASAIGLGVDGVIG